MLRFPRARRQPPLLAARLPRMRRLLRLLRRLVPCLPTSARRSEWEPDVEVWLLLRRCLRALEVLRPAGPRLTLSAAGTLRINFLWLNHLEPVNSGPSQIAMFGLRSMALMAGKSSCVTNV